jgi:hypothetical protein
MGEGGSSAAERKYEEKVSPACYLSRTVVNGKY